jgi:predicted HTH transcriptional regulator
MINPKIEFMFHEVEMTNDDNDNVNVVILEIPAAEGEPVRFEGTAYIRIGSNIKPLIKYKEKEAELWRKFDEIPFEKKIAYEMASDADIVQLLDYPNYYKRLELPIPENREKVLKDLADEKFIIKNDAGTWEVSNYGALMIGADLSKFENLKKKVVRVISYKGKSRIEGISEKIYNAGYAIDFENIIQYIMAIIPQEEIEENGIRKTKYSFPERAIRELLANTVIHQALDQKGTNPMVEIFSDRIEFSNAGAPLVSINRIVDTVPISRNENIAGFMHRCGICEERGSGYDKIIAATCKESIIAPKIENQDNKFTKVVLYSKLPFELTTKEDRVRTCYMMACLAYVTTESINNPMVREVFGLEDKDKVKASRIIKDTIEGGLIKPLDPNTAPRYMKYIPFWA